jgi:hypothetical protein
VYVAPPLTIEAGELDLLLAIVHESIVAAG